VAAVESDDTRVETPWIKIIVEDELKNPNSASPSMSEQERTAFAAVVPPALPQTGQESAPQQP
jgi:hypothetical protein